MKLTMNCVQVTKPPEPKKNKKMSLKTVERIFEILFGTCDYQKRLENEKQKYLLKYHPYL